MPTGLAAHTETLVPGTAKVQRYQRAASVYVHVSVYLNKAEGKVVRGAVKADDVVGETDNTDTARPKDQVKNPYYAFSKS